MSTLLNLALLCLVTLLLTLVEAVVLTWLKWAGFGKCLVSSLAANLVSNLILAILLLLVNQLNFSHLAIGWGLSSLIDGLILLFFRQQPAGRTFFSAFLANLASFLIIILPAFYYGQPGTL